MIDAYLTGRLSPNDSARLMKNLEQDPALKEEFLLQKDLVHSLQAHRKQELKARLNKIEVGPGYSIPSAVGFKILTGVAVVALLGTGAYFAFTPEETETNSESITIPAERQEKELTENLPLIPEATPDDESISLENSNEAESISKEDETSEPSPAEDLDSSSSEKQESNPVDVENIAPVSSAAEEASTPTADVDVVKPDADVVKPEVISFFDDADGLDLSPEADAPEDHLSKIRSINNQNIEVTTRSDSRYTFHYMFFDNQLHIYGDFSKVPYEVLEVNTGMLTNYYLYHGGNYYELNPNQPKVSRLKELQNEDIIAELEITRKEKINK